MNLPALIRSLSISRITLAALALTPLIRKRNTKTNDEGITSTRKNKVTPSVEKTRPHSSARDDK